MSSGDTPATKLDKIIDALVGALMLPARAMALTLPDPTTTEGNH